MTATATATTKTTSNTPSALTQELEAAEASFKLKKGEKEIFSLTLTEFSIHEDVQED